MRRQGLKDIATSRRMTLSDLVGSIDSERKHNLSSAMRLFVLNHYQAPGSIAVSKPTGQSNARAAHH